MKTDLEECRNRIVLIELEKEKEMEDVASLKAFVQETINESRDEDDYQRLIKEIERLRKENLKLNEVLSKVSPLDEERPGNNKFHQPFSSKRPIPWRQF